MYINKWRSKSVYRFVLIKKPNCYIVICVGISPVEFEIGVSAISL